MQQRTSETAPMRDASFLPRPKSAEQRIADLERQSIKAAYRRNLARAIRLHMLACAIAAALRKAPPAPLVLESRQVPQ